MKRTSAQVINGSEKLKLSKNISYEVTLPVPTSQFSSTVSRTLKTKESEVRVHQFSSTEVSKKKKDYVSSANLKFIFRPEYFINILVAL